MGRRNGLAWIERSYGRKGGTSPAAGKTFARYRFTYPDGSGGEKRTLHAIQPTAKVVCYLYNGVWFNAGVYDALPGWANREQGSSREPYTILDAERIG